MAVRIVSLPEHPDDWLRNADEKDLVCKGQGHRFPRIRNGRAPKGLSARKQLDGSYRITFTCPDCGSDRTITTKPGGVLDLPARYSYKYPKSYRAPKGVNRRSALAESWRRMLEDSRSAVNNATEE